MGDFKPNHKRPATPDLGQELKKAKINFSYSPEGSSKDLLTAEKKQATQDTVIPDYKHNMSDSIRNYCLKLLHVNLAIKSVEELTEIIADIIDALVPYPEVKKLFESVGVLELEAKGKIFFTSKNTAPADVERLNLLSKLFQGRYERPENVIQVLNMVQKFMLDTQRLPCTALVQSSGSGKSRLIKELAKTLPTLYICMRDESSQSYPPRSESMKFFDSLNEHVATRSKSQILRDGLFLAIKDYTKFWREQECNVRGEILERAWQYQERSTDLKQGSPGFFKEDFIEESISSPLSQSQIDKIWYTFCEVTKERLEEAGNQSPVKIMLVFDEARHLFDEVDASDTTGTNMSFILYQALRDALMVDRRQGIFSLLVDTMLNVSDFEIPVEISSTDREYFHKQHAPLYQLDTFDVGLIDHRFSLDVHADPYHFLRMGRPLWKLLDYEYKDFSKAEEHLQDKLQLAEELLIGNSGKGDPELMLAAMMIIYGMTIMPNSRFAQSLVSSHMAFLTFVGPNNETVEIRYRSEPLLALCAHNLIRKQEKFEEETLASRMKKSLFDRLTEFLKNHLIPAEEHGELLARVLFTLPTMPKRLVSELTQFRTMNVGYYLKLFGVEVPRNLVSTHGMIHLSHWTRAETPLT